MRRVVHAGGAPPAAASPASCPRRAATDERIQVLEPTAAVALWTHEGRCIGLLARRRDGFELPVLARARPILATGGTAALWERTTNPRGAVGAGLGARRSGRRARWPTSSSCSSTPRRCRTGGARDGFLITEAIRGEGATLLDAAGERFVDELAPRDEVALAIEAELRRSGERAVGLDMREHRHDPLPQHRRRAARRRASTPRGPVPVAPAAHYTMGGVATDLDGRSTRARACSRSASARAAGSTAPTGWRRTRSPSASSSAAAPRSRRCDEPAAPAGPVRRPEPGPRHCPRRARAPRSGATPASSATRRACASCSTTVPARAADRGVRAGARGEPGRTSGGLPGPTGLDGRHVVVAASSTEPASTLENCDVDRAVRRLARASLTGWQLTGLGLANDRSCSLHGPRPCELRSDALRRYDHTILIGDIEHGRLEPGEPLLYARRRMDWPLRLDETSSPPRLNRDCQLRPPKGLGCLRTR